MWGGRFEGETDESFAQFSTSITFDARLYPYDLRCSAEWTKALASAGIVTVEEEKSILDGLDEVRSELDAGSFEFAPTDEDIHTAVERRLTGLIGPVAGKMRTGRSRNDQVATDTRMFAMDACREMISSVASLQGALVDKARQYIDAIVPGHTHLQQAQPVLLAHVLLAFFWMLERDKALLAVTTGACSVMPLGSGALAGTPVAVDRDRLARRLGFVRASENSVDAVSDRDFATDAIYAAARLMSHLSRLAEQVILWCSSEFGLAELDDAWSTGSSLMPQKKNPDGAELVRGKSGRVMGDLVSIMTVLKALPLAYNRDLQEDKEALFDAVDTAIDSLMVMTGTIKGLTFDAGRAKELSGSGFITATDLADTLVEKGVEFPAAHRAAGEVVAGLLAKGKTLEGVTDGELSSMNELFTEGSAAAASTEASVARRTSKGGTAPSSVKAQLDAAEGLLAGA
jgi:argininosuccinate lyase